MDPRSVGSIQTRQRNPKTYIHLSVVLREFILASTLAAMLCIHCLAQDDQSQTGAALVVASQTDESLHAKEATVFDSKALFTEALEVFEEARDGQLYLKDPVKYQAEIAKAFDELQNVFVCLDLVRDNQDEVERSVFAVRCGINLAQPETPPYSQLANTIDITKELALAQPGLADFYGCRLGALLLVAQRCYEGSERIELQKIQSDLVDWDSGRLNAALYFQAAQETYNQAITPSLRWRHVFLNDLNTNLLQLEKDYLKCLEYIHEAKNIAIVYETHSSQLDQVGRSLLERYPAEGFYFCQKSCVTLAKGIDRVRLSPDYKGRDGWINQAQIDLIERMEGLIRNELFPRQRFQEMLSLVEAIAEGFSHIVSRSYQARLFSYAAQCCHVLGMSCAGDYFNRANTLEPGIIKLQAFRDLDAALAR